MQIIGLFGGVWRIFFFGGGERGGVNKTSNFMLRQFIYLYMRMFSPCEKYTYYIGEQRRLNGACTSTYVVSPEPSLFAQTI